MQAPLQQPALGGAVGQRACRQAVLDQLRARQTVFATTVRGTSALIDQRSQGNQSTSDLLRVLMQQVYELDKPMEVFRVLNPALHSAYKRARRVGSTGGSKGDDSAKSPKAG